MKQISLRFTLAVATFLIGVGCVGLWLAGYYLPVSDNYRLVSPVEVQKLEPANLDALSDKVPITEPMFGRDIRCGIPIENLRKSAPAMSDEPADYAFSDKSFESLKNRALLPDDIAIRIWAGGGIAVPRIFALEKIEGKWAAWHVKVDVGKERKKTIRHKVFIEPKSGWDDLWTNLQSYQIDTLPNAAKVGDVEPMDDGEIVYVEIIENGKCRAYSYNLPRYSCLDEAQKLAHIGDVISDEFNVLLF